MFRIELAGQPIFSGFPRVCGDVPPRKPLKTWVSKFSPRMRGCSAQLSAPVKTLAVFPAYAGMFPYRAARTLIGGGFPRVCGDVPQVSSHKAR